MRGTKQKLNLGWYFIKQPYHQRLNELDFKRKSKRQLLLKTKKRYNLTKPISNDTKEDLLDPTLVTLSTTIKI